MTLYPDPWDHQRARGSPGLQPRLDRMVLSGHLSQASIFEEFMSGLLPTAAVPRLVPVVLACGLLRLRELPDRDRPHEE